MLDLLTYFLLYGDIVMCTPDRLPEHPDILLTIFHLVEDSLIPMTSEEIAQLIVDIDREIDSPTLFAGWRESGHLRDRRGRFYVLGDVAKSLQSRGIRPRLDRPQRASWIVDNATVGSW
jgi:hypothetical protein